MATQVDRVTYTVEEAARLLGIGRNTAYEAVARGEVPVIRVGRRLLVPRAALERLMEPSVPAQQTKPDPIQTS